MKDENKTKAQLIEELAELRQRVAELQSDAPPGEATETDLGRAEEALHRRAEELAALQATMLDITTLHDLPTLLQTIVERATLLLDASAGGMYLCDPDQEQVRCVVSYNTPRDYTGTVLKYGEGAAGTIAQTGEPMIIDDYRTWSRRAAVYEEEQPFTAIVSAPMVWQGQVTGVIHVLDDVESRHFTQADLELLTLFANHAAIAVENTQLYEQAQEEIAERVRAEEALRESEDRYRRLSEATFEGIAIHERGVILDTNHAFAAMFGYELSEVTGLNALDFAAPESRDLVMQNILSGYEEPYTATGLRKDGTTFPGELRGKAISYKGRIARVTAMRDITERVRAEEALRRRAAQAALLYEVGQRVSSKLELNALLSEIVTAVYDAFDYYNVMLMLLDEEAERLTLRAIAGGYAEVFSRDLWLAVGEGMIGHAAATGETQVSSDVRQDPHYVRKAKEETKSELAMPIKSGRQVIGVLDIQSNEFDAFDESDVAAMEILSTQIATAIENARLYEQAIQDAETKLVLLQEVNHRVKNNLAAIIGLLYAEQHYARASDRGRAEESAYLFIMDDLINRVQGLATVHSLLSASEWQPLLLSELTDQIIRSASQALPFDKRISVQVSPSPIRVPSAQANSLALVINELATNAIKYASTDREAIQITVHIAMDGDRVHFEFRDAGPGYPEDVLSLERHGVGLYLVQNIVRRELGGELALGNDHGAVTTIRFKIAD